MKMNLNQLRHHVTHPYTGGTTFPEFRT